MSAPSSASIIFSVSSNAALRPTSGLAPAPRPFVNFAPSCNFTGACESFSACRSVFAVMIHAFDLGADHAIDGVAPAAAHSDHLYFRRLKLLAKAHPDSTSLIGMLSP